MTDNKKEGKAVGFFRSKIQRLFRHPFAKSHAVSEEVSGKTSRSVSIGADDDCNDDRVTVLTTHHKHTHRSVSIRLTSPASVASTCTLTPTTHPPPHPSASSCRQASQGASVDRS